MKKQRTMVENLLELAIAKYSRGKAMVEKLKEERKNIDVLDHGKYWTWDKKFSKACTIERDGKRRVELAKYATLIDALPSRLQFAVVEAEKKRYAIDKEYLKCAIMHKDDPDPHFDMHNRYTPIPQRRYDEALAEANQSKQQLAMARRVYRNTCR